MRVLLKAGFNRYSGYGNDGCDIAVWMSRLGVDLHLLPYAVLPGIPQEVADLLTKVTPKGDNAFDATIQFLPPFDIRISDKVSPRIRQPGLPHGLAPLHYGWTMWEKDRYRRQDMIGHGVGTAPWRMLDVMYVTTRMNVEAFAAYDSRPEYRYLPCGIDPDLFPVFQRQLTGPTNFCMVGQLSGRKDPFVAIQAFNELCNEKGASFDAYLHLKTNVPGLHPKLGEWNPRIVVLDALWPWKELIDWYASQHVMLCPSRGEGNHKPPMEFMATGGTVIATNWSGPTNWLHKDAGYALDFKMMPMDHNDPDSPREARASKEHLKELMWHVHTNRAEAAQKGRIATEWIRQSMNWKRIIEKLIGELETDQRRI